MGDEAAFEVRDKRASGKPPHEAASGPQISAGEKTREASHPSQGSHPPQGSFQVTFAAFILSIAASGLIQLGSEPDPATGEKTVNLTGARQTIDILSLLQEKTKGNLTSEEDSYMSQTLFALRMAFVELEKRR